MRQVLVLHAVDAQSTTFSRNVPVDRRTHSPNKDGHDEILAMGVDDGIRYIGLLPLRDTLEKNKKEGFVVLVRALRSIASSLPPPSPPTATYASLDGTKYPLSNGRIVCAHPLPDESRRRAARPTSLRSAPFPIQTATVERVHVPANHEVAPIDLVVAEHAGRHLVARIVDTLAAWDESVDRRMLLFYVVDLKRTVGGFGRAVVAKGAAHRYDATIVA